MGAPTYGNPQGLSRDSNGIALPNLYVSDWHKTFFQTGLERIFLQLETFLNCLVELRFIKDI
jgi:hypothetical protein